MVSASFFVTESSVLWPSWEWLRKDRTWAVAILILFLTRKALTLPEFTLFEFKPDEFILRLGSLSLYAFLIYWKGLRQEDYTYISFERRFNPQNSIRCCYFCRSLLCCYRVSLRSWYNASSMNSAFWSSPMSRLCSTLTKSWGVNFLLYMDVIEFWGCKKFLFWVLQLGLSISVNLWYYRSSIFIFCFIYFGLNIALRCSQWLSLWYGNFRSVRDSTQTLPYYYGRSLNCILVDINVELSWLIIPGRTNSFFNTSNVKRFWRTDLHTVFLNCICSLTFCSWSSDLSMCRVCKGTYQLWVLLLQRLKLHLFCFNLFTSCCTQDRLKSTRVFFDILGLIVLFKYRVN